MVPRTLLKMFDDVRTFVRRSNIVSCSALSPAATFPTCDGTPTRRRSRCSITQAGIRFIEPFSMSARLLSTTCSKTTANRWSMARTLFVTIQCIYGYYAPLSLVRRITHIIHSVCLAVARVPTIQEQTCFFTYSAYYFLWHCCSKFLLES